LHDYRYSIGYLYVKPLLSTIMSLPVFVPQAQLFSTAALASQLFASTDRYRLFAQKIYPLLVQARPESEPI